MVMKIFAMVLAAYAVLAWGTNGLTSYEADPMWLVEMIVTTMLCVSVIAWPRRWIRVVIWCLRLPLFAVFVVAVTVWRSTDWLDNKLVKLRGLVIGQ